MIARAYTGSKLYGFSSENSDTDIHGIFKETLDNIILGRCAHTITKNNGLKGSEKVEESSKELRQFVTDAIKGQSYCIDLLYAPEDMILEDSVCYSFLRENRRKLIGSMKPILGYCRNQAKIYSNKSQRYESLRKCVEYWEVKPQQDQLLEHELYLDDYCFLKNEETKSGIETFYSTASVKFHLNVKVSYLTRILKEKSREYGSRAKDYAAEGIDHKSYCHALRLAYTYIEMCETGGVVFPLVKREFLGRVKSGKIEIDAIESELSDLFSKIEEIEYSNQVDHVWWNQWLIKQYT